MRIIIESIDKDSFELRGFTPMPSFNVQFSSEVFSGVARFIPFSGAADADVGAEFDVELNQGAVTGFRLCEVSIPSIEPLSTLGDFKVRGIVRHVPSPSEPPFNRTTWVSVGKANFELDAEETGGRRLAIGSGVEFVVHDLSMWDEEL
jgi:hypothetical protein